MCPDTETGAAAAHDANPNSEPHSLEQRIRALAFSLWQEAGSPTGRDEEFWHQAREIEETPDTTALASMNHNSITRPQND